MILAEDSLAMLNKELPFPMEMERFRPNIVVAGLGAFEEVSLPTNVFLLQRLFYVKYGLNFMKCTKLILFETRVLKRQLRRSLIALLSRRPLRAPPMSGDTLQLKHYCSSLFDGVFSC